MTVTNRDWAEEYLPKATALIESHGGRFPVQRGNPTQIEGNEPAPDAVIILEFPSREAALEFWNSDEFAPLVRLRQTGSQMEATLLDGFD